VEVELLSMFDFIYILQGSEGLARLVRYPIINIHRTIFLPHFCKKKQIKMLQKISICGSFGVQRTCLKEEVGLYLLPKFHKLLFLLLK
jgi:hypothetical protein